MGAVRIGEEVLGELQQVCEQRQFRPGEEITVKGEQHRAMFFILSGWVEIRFFDDGDDTSPLRIGERSALGEMGFLSGKDAVATAVAVSAVTALEVDQNALSKLQARNPKAAEDFQKYLKGTIDKRLQR